MAPACSTAVECRAQAELAIGQGAFETAHDLAWRAVQRGPHNDPALMYLLARAQSLSGRPDDALVMLRRLAEMGVAVDASTDDFRRVRDLPGWVAVEEMLSSKTAPAVSTVAPVAPPEPKAPSPKPAAPARVAPARLAPAPAAPAAPTAPTAPAAPAAPVAPVAPAALDASASARETSGERRRDEPEDPIEPVVVASAGHFASRDFAPGGLACDAVSRRFVFGDRPGRKLRIVAEGADSSVDLTRGDSAGFLEVMALDIDAARGELWVASADADGGSGTLHKLQLVSGRVLARYEVPAGLAPIRPVDLTVTASGAVLILDAAHNRLVVLRPGEKTLESLVDLQEAAPVSLVSAGRDGVVYVAHRNGISRVDLRTRAVAPVAGPARKNLGGIEHLRRHGSELIGVQARADGSRRLVRLALDGAGQAITRLRLVGMPLPSNGSPALAAVCGDTLAFLVGETAWTGSGSSTEWTFLRIRLAP